MARQNAVRLASGYGDLVVVLLEPSDLAEKVPYDEMMKHSTALQRVDETLNLAFQGNRKVDNTIILDRRPFRSNEIQWEQGENEATRKRNNETAYEGFRTTLEMLRPKVILVCQCQDTVPDGQSSDQWSSSISKAGNHNIVRLGSGYECFRVWSFHPMHFRRYIDGNQEPIKRVMSEYLFDATFVVAANLLAGREFYGFGLSNLRDCAQHGGILIPSEEGVTWSYQWLSEKDCSPPEILAFFFEEDNLKRVPFERLLAIYREESLTNGINRTSPRDSARYDLKADVLSRYQARIPEPSGCL